MDRTVYVRESSLYENINPQEHDWPQHDHFAACLIAQEYSSTTFMSCFYLYKNCALRVRKLRNVGLYEGSV
jgi:hypothetical protein